MTQLQLDILNQGFEPPYVEQDGISVLKTAQHWTTWFVHGPHADRGYLVRPEAYPKGVGPVWAPNSDTAQGLQSTHATHIGGFVQVVDLPSWASDIRVEARVAYYAPGGGMAVRLGLDGTGQTADGNAQTIQWGDWMDQDNGWKSKEWVTIVAQLSQASTGRVSIWLRSQNRWKARNNHVWWRAVTGRCEVSGVTPPDDDEWRDYIREHFQMIHLSLDEIKEHLMSASRELVYPPGNEDGIVQP